MTINEYQKLALTTLSPGLEKDKVLLNGVMGLCGEAGETIDIVKKHLFHSHSLDRDKLKEELGDVAWYLAVTAYALDTDLESVMNFQIPDLNLIYGDIYKDEFARLMVKLAEK